jgi:hypothetical protein
MSGFSQYQSVPFAGGSTLWSGTGAPTAGLGNNGDFYFRTDGSGSNHIYFKAAGSWTGLI